MKDSLMKRAGCGVRHEELFAGKGGKMGKRHKIAGTVKKYTVTMAVAGLGISFLLPILILLSGSLADALEWQGRAEALALDTEGYVDWKWIPDYPTLEQYKRLLFYSPAFLKLFWNSVRMAGMILAGQLLVGIPGAWALASFRFKGRGALFTGYVILMLLPFQVTMLSRYLVVRQLGLLDTAGAVTLPAVFSTFPVFLVYRSFRSIPPELPEAARIDGAGEWRIFVRIGIPLARGGILAAMVLDFLESWNMVEEPLAFLKDKSLWPLSLYLPEIGLSQAGFSCAASLVTICMSWFVFRIFSDSLEKGIINSGL